MNRQIVPAPRDGLSTRDRRYRPILAVHTGDGKGKSTAAFGMALRGWHQGWSIGVFQFVKSGKWRSGEQAAFEALSRLGTASGAGGTPGAEDARSAGGSVEWHALGDGWSWSRAAGRPEDQAAAAAEGWAEVKRRLAAQAHRLYVLDEFTYPMSRGWVDVADVVTTLVDRPGLQHVVITGRRCPSAVIDVASLVTEMTKVKHPFDAGQKGQPGIEW